jgi:hypothetical protein
VGQFGQSLDFGLVNFLLDPRKDEGRANGIWGDKDGRSDPDQILVDIARHGNAALADLSQRIAKLRPVLTQSDESDCLGMLQE